MDNKKLVKKIFVEIESFGIKKTLVFEVKRVWVDGDLVFFVDNKFGQQYCYRKEHIIGYMNLEGVGILDF